MLPWDVHSCELAGAGAIIQCRYYRFVGKCRGACEYGEQYDAPSGTDKELGTGYSVMPSGDTAVTVLTRLLHMMETWIRIMLRNAGLFSLKLVPVVASECCIKKVTVKRNCSMGFDQPDSGSEEPKTYKRGGLGRYRPTTSPPLRTRTFSANIMLTRLTPIVAALFAMVGAVAAANQCTTVCCHTFLTSVGRDAVC